MDKEGLTLNESGKAWINRNKRFLGGVKKRSKKQQDRIKDKSSFTQYPKNVDWGSFKITNPSIFYGWTCPKCGGGNAPHVQRCPCTPMPYQPTVTFIC